MPVATQAWVMHFHPYLSVVAQLQDLYEIASLSYSSAAANYAERNDSKYLTMEQTVPTNAT